MRFVRALLCVLFLVPAAFAHDVTLSGTQSFSALDGSSLDHDGVANGVFTVNDGNLIVNGVVNCNDDGGSDSACAMTFAVSGNMTINSGGALYAENRTGTGTGGAITLNVGGNLVLNGTAIVSTASKSSSGATGGAIAANAGGAVTIASGATIDSGSANARGGSVTIAAGGVVSVDGNVLSGPSRTILATRLTDVVLDGGTSNQIGGAIAIRSATFVEPAVVVGSNANIVSQGDALGAGPVTIDGCGIQIRGLVAALSRKDSAANVAIRSGKALLVDGRDLGAATGTRMGRVRADAPTGTAANKGVDLFAPGTVSILGPGGSLFAVTSHPGVHDSKSYGGTIRVLSTGDGVIASGNVIDDGHSASGDSGGKIDVFAKLDVNLAGAVIRAIGDFSTNNPNRGGGAISVRSYSGNVIWTNGLGEVRPVGSDSGLVPADQGSIVLTACGTINTTGTSFPVMGTATSIFPETHSGVCSPAAPSLPVGAPPFVTCNTPPVANPASAATNEDTAVTVHLSGSDADGDSLTFSIVTPPAHGSLGPVVSTGPTTADVVYTPALNYNGVDSFVFRANDGNGGTNDNTATITIAPVNDPPAFQLGATQTVLEDSGPQTVPNWVTSISPGPADESGQSVTFTVTNDNPSLFSVQPAVAPNGTLTYTPAPNAYGSATITVVAHDNGGTANGGQDTSAPQTSSITVTPVNDAPSFTKGADQTVNEDAGPQTVAGWATAISAGPNEGSQTLTFITSNGNNALFSVQPAVSASGTLTYTPAPNANGSATVTLYLKDDGGTANGGVDSSAPQTFTITVNPVNDAPSFTSGGNVTVLEDSGAYSAAWATSISAGPPDESGQSVNFSTSNNNNALFAVQPSVSATGVLTFTTAANAYGSATVTVTLFDNGGTANGGADTSAPQTFVLTVTAVNDAPSFTGGGNVTVNEDSGSYSAAWASAISAGPNESGQSVAFHASNDNNALFAVQPAVAPNGVLTFTPAANAFGSATVTVYLQDDGGTANGGVDTSATQTFVITVNPVNDAPSFTSGGNVTVNEDSGAYSAAWATGISAGPANESSQTVAFFVSNNNNALFSAQPAVSPGGVLTFTPAANANGSATVTIYAQDDGGTANGGADTSAAQTFTITVTTVNDAPSFTPGGNQTSFEDGGPQSVAWATAISAGPNESTQTVTFVVSNDNNALFSVQPAISPSGTLTYTAAPNMNGAATVTVYLKDDGGTANGGVDQSAPVTFTVTVVAVNDAPSFTPGGNVTVLEDSGAYSAAWATGISAGPADESSQSVSFSVTNSNNALFSVQPAISPSGVLTFTPAANAFGSATVTVTLHDDGGTANGGADTSPSVTFTINVTGVNDAPSFTPGGNVTVSEDSGAYYAAWATSISAGPNESGQSVSFNVSNGNSALFSVQPAISPAGVLTFTPAPNANGTVTVTVSLSDNGGTANGGVDTSASVTFTITITCVNDAPLAVNDTFSTFGNTELRVDLAPSSTPHVLVTTGSGKGVLHNDSDVENDPLTVSGIVGCGDTTAPYDCTLAGGSKLSMNANGSFSFVPGPGLTSASFQYTVADQPSCGSAASATATVTINIGQMIWYVNGLAGAGNGTSVAPFNTFGSLNGAGGVGDVDGPGDIIFVHHSTVNDAISLEQNQKLLGEGVGLIVGSYTLVPAGTKAKIAASGNAVTVQFVTGTEIAGLEISSSGGNGISITGGSLAAGANIHDNAVTAAALQGISVNASSSSATTVSVNNTPITATGNGFDVTSSGSTAVSYTNGTILSTGGSGIRMDGSAGGNLSVTGLSNVTIDGNTAGDGINIVAATFDAVPGGSFGTVSGGAIAIGTNANPVGGAGMVLSNVSGDFAAGSLNVFAAGGAGVSVAGSGLFTGSAGMRVTNGGGEINASSGVGLSVTNATIGAANLNFTSISSNGGANGIALNNTGSVGGLIVAGSGSAGSGGTIQNTTADGVSLRTTQGVSLTSMNVTNTAWNGVAGSGVVGFTFSGGSISNAGTAAAGAAKEGGIAFNEGITFTEANLTGSVTIANSTISSVRRNAIDITNWSGTISSLSITGNTLTSSTSSAVSLGHAILVAMQGSSTATASVTTADISNNQITNFPSGSGIFVTGGVSGSPVAFTMGIPNTANAISISNNRIAGASAAVPMGSNAIAVAAAGCTGQANFVITNNGTVANPLTNFAGIGISHFIAGTVNATATISGNVIVANNTAGASGIATQVDASCAVTDAAVSVVSITNNSVSATQGNGIRGLARASNGTLDLTVRNNTVGAPTLSNRNGIRVDSGSSAGNVTLCLDIAGNVSAGSGVSKGIGLRKQGTNPAVNKYGIVGMAATSTPGVEAYVDSQNPAGGATELLSATTGFTNCSM